MRISGGLQITTTANQNIMTKVREVENEFHPNFNLTDSSVLLILKQLTINVQTPCTIRINDGSPISVKGYYSNADISKIEIIEPDIEVTLAYVY